MQTCPNCKVTNEDTSIFCQICGTELNQSQNNNNQTTPMRCTLCGNEGSQNFYQDEGRMEPKNFSFNGPVRVIMMTCNHCGHIELFNRSRFKITFD